MRNPLPLLFAVAVGSMLLAACGGRDTYKDRAAAPVPTETTPKASTSRPSAYKRSTSPSSGATGTDVENTERNTRDRDEEAAPTPDDQGGSSSDLEITAAIRRAIVDDDSLSVNAHNAKIITRQGMVTLRGPVESREEKTRLQSIAARTRGVKRVDNQLEIKTR